jgi:hypothetical protein
MGAEIRIRRHLSTEPHHHQRLTAESHRLRRIRQLTRRIQLVPWRLTHLRECMTK